MLDVDETTRTADYSSSHNIYQNDKRGHQMGQKDK